MAFVVKSSGTFTPSPEGLHNAVCVDVADLGMVESTWQGKTTKKHMARLAFEIEAEMEDGRRFIATKRYNASLHEKATLHKDLRSWRGRAFTADELAGFDLENVLGAPCRLLIQHSEKDGQTYANIVAITKADPNAKLTPSGAFVRFKDREENKTNGNGADDGELSDDALDSQLADLEAQSADEPIPF